MTPINGLNDISRISLKTEPLSEKIDRRDTEFAQRIKDAMGDVNDRQHRADEGVKAVINGEIDYHEGMILLGQADTSLRLLTQVRGKIMTAYNEIMRMQV